GYTMIAFGGAAPLHAGRLCEKLGIDRLLVPPGAGVGSAIGFLRAPFSFEANRSVYMTLSDFDPVRITDLLGDLQSEATGFVRTCDADSPINCEFKVYMRYTGQGWEIPVTLTEAQATAPDAATFLSLFEADYTRLFGRTVAGLDVEITVWSVNATTPPSPVEPLGAAGRGGTIIGTGTRAVFDPALAQVVDAAVVARTGLMDGATIDGPAVLTEDETTIIIPASRTATHLPDGCIDLTRKATP
ncbi:hydantoinase/oxoprolinase family protein, partial [Jannaschia helgolandensis]|uniref:hydantoinase/oxoprolinase family protein n=1 Tax=Jannaschia helgolandensis TaxID=188906 RepID=UPI0030DB4BAA